MFEFCEQEMYITIVQTPPPITIHRLKETFEHPHSSFLLFVWLLSISTDSRTRKKIHIKVSPCDVESEKDIVSFRKSLKMESKLSCERHSDAGMMQAMHVACLAHSLELSITVNYSAIILRCIIWLFLSPSLGMPSCLVRYMAGSSLEPDLVHEGRNSLGKS
jgi:hypothetical protein